MVPNAPWLGCWFHAGLACERDVRRRQGMESYKSKLKVLTVTEMPSGTGKREAEVHFVVNIRTDNFLSSQSIPPCFRGDQIFKASSITTNFFVRGQLISVGRRGTTEAEVISCMRRGAAQSGSLDIMLLLLEGPGRGGWVPPFLPSLTLLRSVGRCLTLEGTIGVV